MFFRKVRSEGLSAISYFVGSGEEAIVVDPRRDTDVYGQVARDEDMRIAFILETHRHEDFVVGSANLAKATGARVLHGPGLDFDYGEMIKDGETHRFGDLSFTALHTPGHTDESTSYALSDLSAGKEPFIVFTGDTLFVNDVGRTDMYGPEETPRLSAALYDSLSNKILPLGDGTIICPAHGAGSVCGKAISEREESTIGFERGHNPALQLSKVEFVRTKVAEKHPFPPYFRHMEVMNLRGRPDGSSLPYPEPLSPERFKRRLQEGATIVDTRPPSCFAGAYIGGAYNIQIDGLASFTGAILHWETPLLLILERGEGLDVAVRRLHRIGYDNIVGYLRDGMVSWYEASLPTEHMGLLTVQELRGRIDGMLVIDVRSEEEYGSGHIEGALHIPCRCIEKYEDIPDDRPIAVTCSIGYRGTLAASIMRKRGFTNVHNVLGGMNAWKEAGYPLSYANVQGPKCIH
jgi:hydroxyacylglutathione hydrolase